MKKHIIDSAQPEIKYLTDSEYAYRLAILFDGQVVTAQCNVFFISAL